MLGHAVKSTWHVAGTSSVLDDAMVDHWCKNKCTSSLTDGRVGLCVKLYLVLLLFEISW